MTLKTDNDYLGHTLKLDRVYDKEGAWRCRTHIALTQTGSKLIIFEHGPTLAKARAAMCRRIDAHLANPAVEYERALAAGVEFLPHE